MNTIYKTSKKILLSIMVLATALSYSQNNEQNQKDIKYFDGFYLGLSIGSQNIFGGAFIDDLDVLAQKSGLVIEFTPGFRKQILNNKIMIGAEIQYGITSVNLNQIDMRSLIHIGYQNNYQFGYGLNLGVVIGKNKNVLLYTYGYVTKRNFNIIITDIFTATFNQKDGQRFGRYGIGLETPIFKKFNIKASVGKVTVDYGDLATNMEVEDKIDFNLGIIYQF